MRAKNSNAIEKREPSQWHKQRMTRQERALKAKLEPASSRHVELSPAAAQWFCLVVVEGAELSVRNRLQSAGVDVLVPTETAERKDRKGNAYKVERACFVGYVFVRIVRSLLAFERLREVKGVLDFLRAGETYHVISNRDIGFCVPKAHAERIAKDKTIGDGMRVRIWAGPFAGLDAVVLQVINPKGRDPECRLYIESFKREIKRHPLAFLERL